MNEYQSLSHTRWDCKYHVLFIPKRRKSKIFGGLRKHLGDIFHDFSSHNKSRYEKPQPVLAILPESQPPPGLCD